MQYDLDLKLLRKYIRALHLLPRNLVLPFFNYYKHLFLFQFRNNSTFGKKNSVRSSISFFFLTSRLFACTKLLLISHIDNIVVFNMVVG